MKLFLDFDGCTHPHPCEADQLFCCTPMVWQILRACPTVLIVFSTSWKDSHTWEELLDFATYGGGEDLAHRFVGSTPSLENEGCYGRRDLEIESWLNANNYSGLWLALDDMPEIFSGGHPNLYVVDGQIGLTEVDVEAIIQRIQREVQN